MTPQEQSILRSMDETTAGLKSIRAKLLDALKLVGAVRADDASIEYLLDAVLSYWAGAREAAAVNTPVLARLREATGNEGQYEIGSLALLELLIKQRDARPTPEAWTISCRLIDAAIDKIRAALKGTRFGGVHGLASLVEGVIAERDGWKTGAGYQRDRAEEAVRRGDRWKGRWLTLNSTAAGVGSTASAAAIKSDPMTATGAVDLAMGVGIFGDSIGPTADVVRKIVEGVIGQREEILRAFVAKYGFEPDEAVQVTGPDGSWRVERRFDSTGVPEFNHAWAVRNKVNIVPIPTGGWQAQLHVGLVSGDSASVGRYGSTVDLAITALRHDFPREKR